MPPSCFLSGTGAFFGSILSHSLLRAPFLLAAWRPRPLLSCLRLGGRDLCFGPLVHEPFVPAFEVGAHGRAPDSVVRQGGYRLPWLFFWFFGPPFRLARAFEGARGLETAPRS